MIMLIGMLVLKLNSIESVLSMLIVSCGISLLVSVIMWYRDFDFLDIGLGSRLTMPLLKRTSHFWLFGMIILFNQWVSQMLVGHYMPALDVGVFSVAQRISFLFIGITVAVSGVLSPKIITSIRNNDLALLKENLKLGMWILMILGGVGLLFLINAADFILTLFGEEFSRGRNVLVILSIAQFLYLFSCLLSWVIIAYGFEKRLRFAATLMLITNISLSLLLINKHGVEGASFAQLGAVTLYLILLYRISIKAMNDIS